MNASHFVLGLQWCPRRSQPSSHAFSFSPSTYIYPLTHPSSGSTSKFRSVSDSLYVSTCLISIVFFFRILFNIHSVSISKTAKTTRNVGWGRSNGGRPRKLNEKPDTIHRAACVLCGSLRRCRWPCSAISIVIPFRKNIVYETGNIRNYDEDGQLKLFAGAIK